MLSPSLTSNAPGAEGTHTVISAMAGCGVGL